MCKTVLSEVKDGGNKDNQAETGQRCPNKISGGARGGLGGGGLQSPRRRHLAPPRRRKFWFSSEQIWQNNSRKHHFSVFLAPLSETPAPLSENFWRHPLNKIGSVVHAKVQNILFENAQPVSVKPAEIVDTTHGTRTVQNTNDYMDLITF